MLFNDLSNSEANRKRLKDYWDGESEDKVKNLIVSWPYRLKKVLKKKGGDIGY